MGHLNKEPLVGEFHEAEEGFMEVRCQPFLKGAFDEENGILLRAVCIVG